MSKLLNIAHNLPAHLANAAQYGPGRCELPPGIAHGLELLFEAARDSGEPIVGIDVLACASPLPESPAVRAVLRDLREKLERLLAAAGIGLAEIAACSIELRFDLAQRSAVSLNQPALGPHGASCRIVTRSGQSVRWPRE